MTISSILRLLFNFRHLHFSGKYKQRRYWATKISQQNRENLLKFKNKNLLPHSKISQRNRAKNICWNFKKYICGHTKDFSAKQMKGYFLKLKKNICRHTKDCFAKMDKEETKTSEMKFVKGIMRSGPTGWLFLNYTPPPKKTSCDFRKYNFHREYIIIYICTDWPLFLLTMQRYQKYTGPFN